MKRVRYLAQISLAAPLLVSLAAWAQTENYRARLSPMPTTPQTVDSITGEGEVFLSLEGNFPAGMNLRSRRDGNRDRLLPSPLGQSDLCVFTAVADPE